MKKSLIMLIAMFSLLACGSTKKVTTAKKEDQKTMILPPDVGSNKYAKKRN
jgi:uncharacterized protein YcfL|tara:strand:- start:308 stop:460 length:153 start_codon:yes stop_codon:yes gene_type:complete